MFVKKLNLNINKPPQTKSAFGIPSFRKIVIRYNLEEYFGINIEMKVIDFEFLILSIQLNSSLLL